jgi:DNA-binding transcriptional LysR family regulator
MLVNRPRLDGLEELRTFVTIVDAGSLASAAKKLGVTPNAVSRRLGLLEDRLGRRLIHRSTRRLSITDEGRRFHTRCRRILAEAEDAERELLGADDRESTLRLRIHSAMVSPSLMDELRDLLNSSPALRVQLRITTQFVEPIAAGLDLSVYVGRPPASSLVSVPLGDLVWMLAAAPSYLDRRGRPRTPSDLIQHECLRVLRSSPETHWDLSYGKGPSQRLAIGGRFEVSDARGLSEALTSGIGIGVALQSELAYCVRTGRLEQVLPGWQASRPVFALLPKGRKNVPAVRRLLEVLRRGVRGLA